MAKHKGKRSKSKRDGEAPSGALSTATAVKPQAPAQSGTAPPRSEVVEGLRVEGNVIHLPKPAERSEENVSSRPTMRAGSGGSEAPARADANPLRSNEAERERNTVPPAPADEEPTPAAATEATEEKADAKTEAPAKVEAAEAPAKPEEKKPEEKKPEARKKSDEKKRDVLVGRGEGERRDRKESLSAHLSDEARAFFSDKSLEAAYKPHHDTFEDLTPAHEEHAHEVARSRRWMRVTGMLLVGVVIVVGGFMLQSRYGVQETNLNTRQFQPEPAPTPAPAPAAENPAPTPAPAAENPAPAPAPAAESPAPAPAPAAENPTPAPAPVAESPAPTPAPTPAAVNPAPTPAPVAETPAPTPAPAAAPDGQTPAQLLAAARRTGRIDAWEAYFNAAPTEDRLMATTAMSMAERGRNADAERLAQRAVTANPSNGQAWFVLAVVRGALRNRDGAREARQRCIELGGRWAGECRGI